MKNQLFPPKRKLLLEDVEAIAEKAKKKKLKNNIF
jgi:hypothetical protein